MLPTEPIDPTWLRRYIVYERRRSMVRRWYEQGRINYRAVTDQYEVKGIVFDADRLTDDTSFATISLLVNA